MKHLISTLALSALLAGCGAPTSGLCAQGGEPTGLAVTVRDAMGPQMRPRAGAYFSTVTTEVGEVEWACTISADDRSGAGCVADRIVRLPDLPDLSDRAEGDDAPVLLVSAVADDEEFWISVQLIDGEDWRGPDEVHIVIERDGERVADEEFAPSYVLSPLSGGEGCPRYYVVDGDADQSIEL